MGGKFLKVREVAGILGVHYSTVMKEINKGNLKAYKVGDVWKVSEGDLEGYLEARSNMSSKEIPA